MAEKAMPNVTVQDATGGKTRASINLGASLLGNWTDKSDNLKNFIDEFSDGVVSHRSDVFSHGVTLPNPVVYGPGAYKEVHFKARVVFRDPANDSIHTIQIPCPKESLFESKNGDKIVTEAAGSAIQAKLLSELGLAWQFIRGEICND